MSNRIIACHDLSCYGRASLTIAIPILTRLGLEVCPLPTALLSTHTAYEGYTFLDLTDQMKDVVRHWKELKLSFNAFYSGFLGNTKQVDLILDVVSHFQPQFIVVDPVLGDDGKCYSTIDTPFITAMRRLTNRADLITPNLTEFCLLLDMPFDNVPPADNISDGIKVLCSRGPRYCVVTSIVKGNQIQTIGYDREESEFHTVSTPRLPLQLCGTGDTFTSLLTGLMHSGMPFHKALEQSVQWTTKAIAYMEGADIHSRRAGVGIERLVAECIQL